MQLKCIFINVFIQLKGLGVVEFLKLSVKRILVGSDLYVKLLNLVALMAMI